MAKKSRQVRIGNYTDAKWQKYKVAALGAGMTLGNWIEKACDLLVKRS